MADQAAVARFETTVLSPHDMDLNQLAFEYRRLTRDWYMGARERKEVIVRGVGGNFPKVVNYFKTKKYTSVAENILVTENMVKGLKEHIKQGSAPFTQMTRLGIVERCIKSLIAKESQEDLDEARSKVAIELGADESVVNGDDGTRETRSKGGSSGSKSPEISDIESNHREKLNVVEDELIKGKISGTEAKEKVQLLKEIREEKLKSVENEFVSGEKTDLQSLATENFLEKVERSGITEQVLPEEARRSSAFEPGGFSTRLISTDFNLMDLDIEQSNSVIEDCTNDTIIPMNIDKQLDSDLQKISLLSTKFKEAWLKAEKEKEEIMKVLEKEKVEREIERERADEQYQDMVAQLQNQFQEHYKILGSKARNTVGDEKTYHMAPNTGENGTNGEPTNQQQSTNASTEKVNAPPNQAIIQINSQHSRRQNKDGDDDPSDGSDDDGDDQSDDSSDEEEYNGGRAWLNRSLGTDYGQKLLTSKGLEEVFNDLPVTVNTKDPEELFSFVYKYEKTSKRYPQLKHLMTTRMKNAFPEKSKHDRTLSSLKNFESTMQYFLKTHWNIPAQKSAVKIFEELGIFYTPTYQALQARLIIWITIFEHLTIHKLSEDYLAGLLFYKIPVHLRQFMGSECVKNKKTFKKALKKLEENSHMFGFQYNNNRKNKNSTENGVSTNAVGPDPNKEKGAYRGRGNYRGRGTGYRGYNNVRSNTNTNTSSQGQENANQKTTDNDKSNMTQASTNSPNTDNTESTGVKKLGAGELYEDKDESVF